MNIIRFVLITMLALVGYKLIYQWKEDFNTDQPMVSSIAPVSAMAEKQGSSSDLPTAPILANTKNTTPIAPNQLTQDPTITVTTDVLSLKINLKGGDIVYAALNKYPVSIEKSNQPFVLLNQDTSLNYIAQSGVVGVSGKDLDATDRPVFKTEKTNYQLVGDQLDVVLDYVSPQGLSAKKIFHFKKSDYNVKVEYDIANNTAQTWQGSFFAQLKRDSSPDPSNAKSTGFRLPTYMGAAYGKPEEKYNKLKFTDIEKKGDQSLNEMVKGGWVAIIQHYFISAWAPNERNQNNHFYAKKIEGENIIGLNSPLFNVSPSAHQMYSADLYLGPKIQDQLKKVADGLDLAVDYGILFFISHILYLLLKAIHLVVGNWGWSVILLTLCVKLLFFYPSTISYRSMAKMRKVQPELLRIREKYSSDKQGLSQAMMKLYRDEKINPLGGCLPVLLQMPVFIALYWTLLESVELRHSGFILWIKDLSVMDPYLILPLLMGVSMFIQSHLNPAPPDPMQAKLMKWMPVMFTFFFLFFPAGLVLYWLTNNVLSILQQWYITKKIEAES